MTTFDSSRHEGQNDMSKTTITAKMHADGTVVEVLPDGVERPFFTMPMRPMTEAQVHAAAINDHDARPMTESELGRARRIPRIKTMRRALQLTQEEFASRYHIALGTLRDWEQGRSEPDQTAQAYLWTIAARPDVVFEALQAHATPS